MNWFDILDGAIDERKKMVASGVPEETVFINLSGHIRMNEDGTFDHCFPDAAWCVVREKEMKFGEK